MTREALKDAFIAGWYVGQARGESAIADFNRWYTSTMDTLNRANPDVQIEAGHFYRAANGDQIGPMSWVDDDLWCSTGAFGHERWTDNGVCVDGPNHHDITYEWGKRHISRSPSTDANPDGWIEWDGSAGMPPGLSGDTMVEVVFKHGGVETWADEAQSHDWKRDDVHDYIIRYRRSQT